MSESTVHRLIDAIDPLALGVALKLTGAKAGATRNLALIVAEAVKYGADERIVACIFGFAADAKRPGEWVDFLLEPEALPVIDSPEMSDAYTLAVTIFGDCVAERRASVDRVLDKLRRSQQNSSIPTPCGVGFSTAGPETTG